jgi:hypothetical protein
MATSSRLMPLAYLLRVMRDPAQPMDLRMRAAIAALPYTHAKRRRDDVPRPNGKAPASPEMGARTNRRLSLVKPAAMD